MGTIQAKQQTQSQDDAADELAVTVGLASLSLVAPDAAGVRVVRGCPNKHVIKSSKLLLAIASEDVALHILSFLTLSDAGAMLCSASKRLSSTPGEFAWTLSLLRAFAQSKSHVSKGSLVAAGFRGGSSTLGGGFSTMARVLSDLPSSFEPTATVDLQAPRSPRPCDGALCGLCLLPFKVTVVTGSAQAEEIYRALSLPLPPSQRCSLAPPPTLIRLECPGACRISLLVQADHCSGEVADGACSALCCRKCDGCEGRSFHCAAHALGCNSCPGVLCEDCVRTTQDGDDYCVDCSWFCEVCLEVYGTTDAASFECGTCEQGAHCVDCWIGARCCDCEEQMCEECGQFAVCGDCGCSTCSNCFGDSRCQDCDAPTCADCGSHFE